jgi:hypothetical protein
MRWLTATVLGLSLVALTAAGARAQGGSDVYHVHFTKAAPGQAAALGKAVSTADPKAPMPGHFIVLRHQEGDDWDYAVIEHLGAKAAVDPAAAPPPPAVRDLSAWHTDTFASGPSWAEFTKAMGLTEASGTAGSVYILSVFRAAPGHREQLMKAISGDAAPGKVPVGRVLLQHMEGGPWNFLTLNRYNSWQDLATDRSAAAGASGSATDGWADTRQHVAYHQDTIADRLAPR